MDLSVQKACHIIGLNRSNFYYKPKGFEKDQPLIRELHRLAQKYPRFGYRKIHKMLREQGEVVSRNKVQKLWKQEGLQVQRQKRVKKSSGCAQNSCHLRDVTQVNQGWSVDFVSDQTMDGRNLKILTVSDDMSREALAVEVERKMGQKEVCDVLERLMEQRGRPSYVRSDNGKEFVGRGVKLFLQTQSVESAPIAPGSPWQNGKNERLNGILREEELNRRVYGNLLEAKVFIEEWRRTYNEVRPHGAIDFMTPSEFAAQAKEKGLWY